MILVALLFGSACTDGGRAEELARQEAMLIAQQQEADRQAAILAEMERARLEQEALERRQSLSRKYSKDAGRQIMDEFGGGQDLIVRTGQWSFDDATMELEIPMDVSFNGWMWRSNNYRVSGLLTIREDGSKARFARAEANKRYLDKEKMFTRIMIAAGVAGTVYILSEMAE